MTKEQSSTYHRQYRKKNIDSFLKREQKYRQTDWYKKYQAEYRLKNIERRRELDRKYRLKNIDIKREKDLVYGKEYRKKNNASIKIKACIRRRGQGMKPFTPADPLRVLSSRSLRTYFREYLMGRCKRFEEILRKSVPDFRKYIQTRFLPGMNWSNYGKYDPNKQTWHYDHDIPLKYWDLTDSKQLKLAWHWSNIKPMWAEDNLKKQAQLPLIMKFCEY
jgi:hypothetical protein